MPISIIIPTFNEASQIREVLDYLYANANKNVCEIIVVDGFSNDRTAEIAKEKGAKVLLAPQKGRATQMNFAVKQSVGDILYFVHADSRPPKTYASDIKKAINEGYQIGGYRFKFRSEKMMLKLNSFMTRFNFLFCRGGDQTIFITRKLFDKLGGYNDQDQIMEEYNLMKAARKITAYKLIPKSTSVSARKYEENSYLRVNFANFIVFNMWRLGFAQEKIHKMYKSILY